MSYLQTIEYKIVPLHSYKMIRNCSGCGSKSRYVNTENFRVNANGNKIDIWLIYQCEKCRHTCNLSVFERIKPTEIPSEDYRRFLANDKELALSYGMNKSFFTKNKAQIDKDDIMYELIPVKGDETAGVKKADEVGTEVDQEEITQIMIYNPYELKIRLDKVVAEILQLSRSRVRKLLEEGKVKVTVIK